MVVPKSNPDELRKQARYLLSIACLVKDAAKRDELQQKAGELLVKAQSLAQNDVATGNGGKQS
jgi:hypothetical protein